MTQISLEELIKLIKESPEYLKWELEVPPEQALYISFYKEKTRGLSSEVFTLKNGSELVLDIDSEGIVYGIEII